MVTQNNSIKVQVKMCENVQSQLGLTLLISGIIIASSGTALLIGCIFEIVISILYGAYSVDFVFPVLAAGLIAIGVIYIVLYCSQIKFARKQDGDITEYEFFEGHVMIDQYKKDVQISKIKLFYNDIVRSKQTRDYIFIFFMKNIATHVTKAELSPEELATLKSILKLPYDNNVQLIQLGPDPVENRFAALPQTGSETNE